MSLTSASNLTPIVQKTGVTWSLDTYFVNYNIISNSKWILRFHLQRLQLMKSCLAELVQFKTLIREELHVYHCIIYVCCDIPSKEKLLDPVDWCQECFNKSKQNSFDM